MSFAHDRKRFLRYYSRGDDTDSQVNIKAHVIFNVHRIEKGLSHVDFRDGFGLNVLRDLRRYMEKLTDRSSLVYKAALSVIKEYVEVHEGRNYDISIQKDIIGVDLLEQALSSSDDMSGYLVFDRNAKKSNKKKNFKELFINRYTVREYSTEPVDLKKIREAVEISTKTPSICNRQSFRIMIMTDEAMIKKAIDLQNGFKSYDYPPVLALVLTDTRLLRSVSERNNAYIDGGLFLMSFLLGLEYEGLAACTLNTMFSVKKEKEVRNVLGVDDNYNFIAYVAIGNFRDENKVAKSFRLPVDEVII